MRRRAAFQQPVDSFGTECQIKDDVCAIQRYNNREHPFIASPSLGTISLLGFSQRYSLSIRDFPDFFSIVSRFDETFSYWRRAYS